MSDPQQSQQRLQQFLQLLPVTMAIAGLPSGEHGKYYNDDQMELRGQALRRAFKHAKTLAKEIAATE